MEFTPEVQLLIIKLEKAEVSPKDKQWPLAIKSSLPGESDADAKSIYFIAKTLIKDEPKKALELLIKSSEMGCIMATLHLAQAYHLGSNGISKQPDMKEAFKWYIKASENGNAMASYFLATSLSLGRHTETNFFEACNFFRRTLEQLGDQIPPPDMVVSWDQNKVPKLTSEDVGAEVKSKLDLYVSSLFQLGGLYLQGGNGLKQDFQQSFKFVEHGSKFNHGPCVYGVGLAYMEGLGVEVNMELATSAFHRAIKLDPSLQLPPNIPRP
jgi:TPR repeat protein